MRIDDSLVNFDPRFEDPRELRGLTRRGFLGRLLVGTAAGAALSSFGVKAFAAPTPSLSGLGTSVAPDDEPYWELVASEFLLRKGLAYMNTGTRGPSPRSVHMAQLDALSGVNSDYLGFTKNVCNKDFLAMLRSKLAGFVGAKPSEIAFTSNTTEGMVFGTLGVDLKPGDEIAYTNHDHLLLCTGGNARSCVADAVRRSGQWQNDVRQTSAEPHGRGLSGRGQIRVSWLF
ncbi:MAG: aminotransferase class V-fold PLP-dependent enzyme [Deltaproteobacteria bacterium]|nr:aminotransferase class V-fold PLP-dependent enzyme [Deltaproteobacteria bacterium]